MRKFVSLICMLIAARALTFAEAPDLGLRTKYYASAEDSDSADEFYEMMKPVSDGAPPVSKAYKAMSAMLLAKHAINPVNKISYFREGRSLLEKVIKEQPANPELRFLRFTVQENAPFFLDYSGDREDDLKHIYSFLSDPGRRNADPDLTRRMAEYLREGEGLSDQLRKELGELPN